MPSRLNRLVVELEEQVRLLTEENVAISVHLCLSR
jgi:hypothetical protein